MRCELTTFAQIHVRHRLSAYRGAVPAETDSPDSTVGASIRSRAIVVRGSDDCVQPWLLTNAFGCAFDAAEHVVFVDRKQPDPSQIWVRELGCCLRREENLGDEIECLAHGVV